MRQQPFYVVMRHEVIGSAAEVSLTCGVVVPAHGTDSAAVLFQPIGDFPVEAAELSFTFSCSSLASGAADDSSRRSCRRVVCRL